MSSPLEALGCYTESCLLLFNFNISILFSKAKPDRRSNLFICYQTNQMWCVLRTRGHLLMINFRSPESTRHAGAPEASSICTVLH
jgi:hypothetical protein